MIRDGQYGRISLGKHNSIFIGGVAHELGHALGLPHNRQRQDEQVVFVSRADGEEKCRSPVTKAGKRHSYEVDLGGVKELQLSVEDAGDGTGSDWGLWLAPTLSK